MSKSYAYSNTYSKQRLTEECASQFVEVSTKLSSPRQSFGLPCGEPTFQFLEPPP
jgi:hypothetical protein